MTAFDWQPVKFNRVYSMFAGVLGLQLTENGEYTNIVIKVEKDIPEQSCASLLNNLKVGACHNNNNSVVK